MRIVQRSLVLAVIWSVFSVTQAYATNIVVARVPFDFMVNGQMFHAGQYEVDRLPDANGVLAVKGRDGQSFSFVMSNPAAGHDPAGSQPALVFLRREKGYELWQVWETDHDGRQIPKF